MASIGRDVAPGHEHRPKRHREPGHVPYPLEFTSDDQDFDVWDLMFIKRARGRFTRHDFGNKPPKHALDLGCGSGTWVIACAKEWPEATFVGFDLADIQPDLSQLGQQNLANRVRWVHGNFLEKLPFANEEFGYVRISDIGFGVPEDEWQDVIEEVVRVLQPGGVLEIHEDDLIFPCPPLDPLGHDEYSTPSPASTITLKFPSHLTAQNDSTSPADTPSSPFGDSSTSDFSSDVPSPEQARRDIRDHSRLKQAFDQMLSRRFINPKVTSMLPFFLQSTFHEVQPQPLVATTLPAPSNARPTFPVDGNSTPSIWLSLDSGVVVDAVSGDAMNDRRLAESINLDNFDTVRRWLQPSEANYFRSCLYLARAVRLVTGCKEEMWVEYERMHRHERSKPNPRLDREDFDFRFQNWLWDMQDRIGMRSALLSALSWREPPSLERPGWRAWKEAEAQAGDDDTVANDARDDLNICRVQRAFFCRKQERPSTELSDAVAFQ